MNCNHFGYLSIGMSKTTCASKADTDRHNEHLHTLDIPRMRFARNFTYSAQFTSIYLVACLDTENILKLKHSFRVSQGQDKRSVGQTDHHSKI